jgi:hypothetical protein
MENSYCIPPSFRRFQDIEFGRLSIIWKVVLLLLHKNDTNAIALESRLRLIKTGIPNF